MLKLLFLCDLTNQIFFMKRITLVAVTILLTGFLRANAQEAFIGEIRMFAGNFAPRGWAFCQGQILSIAQNTALFSILGTTYGGNGQTTFALPDLRGRVPVGTGQGPGLPMCDLGEVNGSYSVTLTASNMPVHTHSVSIAATTIDGDTSNPADAIPANTKALDKEYSTGASNTFMKANTTTTAGGSQPFDNRQPYLGMNYIIAIEGIYPSRW